MNKLHLGKAFLFNRALLKLQKQRGIAVQSSHLFVLHIVSIADRKLYNGVAKRYITESMRAAGRTISRNKLNRVLLWLSEYGFITVNDSKTMKIHITIFGSNLLTEFETCMRSVRTKIEI